MSKMKVIERGQVRAYTFKEGLFAAVAHDLELELMDFQVRFNGGDVIATFELRSFSVLGAIIDEKPSPKTLTASDRNKIEQTVHREVLKTRRYPKAELSGCIIDGQLEGTLTLCGMSAPVNGPVTSMNARATGSVEIKPSIWGIKPYSALFGTLKLKDRVRIEYWMDLPL
jgi:hypothetical protein